MDRTTEPRIVTELPIGLKQLARLAVRAFYSIEEVQIIDTLVTYPCMKEADIAEFLHFEKKKIRGHISNLCNAKFLEMRLKMETGPDGKTQKVHYYFINFKTLLNVIKYKLHMARNRIEDEEQLKPLYDLLQGAENIKLAPELLEPKPVDINTIKSRIQPNAPIPDGKQWSGEATRNKDLLGGISIEISDDDAGVIKKTPEPKALPIWLTESTVGVDTDRATDRASLPNDAAKSMTTAFGSNCDSNSPTFDFNNVIHIDADKENDEESDVPKVLAGGRPMPLDQINEEIIAQMTPEEKLVYTRLSNILQSE